MSANLEGRRLASDPVQSAQTRNFKGPENFLTVHTIVEIKGKRISALLDGGSSITCISERMLRDLNCSGEHLQTRPYTAETANGSPLQILGSLREDIFIGEKAFNHEIVACADLKEDLILGVDFLVPNKCLIDYDKRIFKIAGQTVPLHIGNGQAVAKITVEETITIPARQEIIFNAKSSTSSAEECILEPNDNVLERQGLLVARVLAAPKNGDFPVRIINPSNVNRELRVNSALGDIYPIASISNPFTAEVKETPVQFNIGNNLKYHEREKLNDLLVEYKDVFSRAPGDLGRFRGVYHEINTGDALPIRKCPYRVPGHLKETVKDQVQTMLKAGVIEESKSPWSSPILLVKKKSGDWRFCVDFRGLNSCTKKDSFPLPRTDDTLDALSGSKLFSVIDMASGYWQLEVHPKDREKTAFVTSEGLYQFNVLPFGLCNGPSSYQRMMQFVLSGLNWRTCLIYLDDVIIFAPDFETHQRRLREVLDRIREANLKLQPSKCKFAYTDVLYLGHVVSAEGIFPDPAKIEAVRQYPRPSNLKEVQSFLGLCSYYRRFISDFARVAQPLHRLTHKNTPFIWDADCENSFQTLKHLLISPPILAYPDFHKPFLLATDASGTGLGAVLSQIQEGGEKVICYASRLLSKSERNYSTIERETLALIWATDMFRAYLYGRKFTLFSDHNPLCWLRSMKEPQGKFARWIMKLEEFDYEIIHKAGKNNRNADALSRLPEKHFAGFRAENTKKMEENCTDPTVPIQMVQAMQLQASYTNQDWSLKQEADPVLSAVRAGLKSNHWSQPKDTETRAYWRHRNTLRIRDDVLFRESESNPDGERIWQLIVPKQERDELLELAHDIPMAGHFGISRTLERLKQGFYWVGIAGDVEKWCRECRDCATKKPPPQYSRAPLISMPQAERPFEMLALDIVGPLKTTRRGNKFILVVTDYFSRWPEAFALPNQEASTVATALMENVVSRFGLPLVIMTDQGRNFESQLFRELCQILGVKKLRTSAYHPMCNGLVENCNKTLITELSMYTSSQQDDWDEWLPHCLLAYRTSRHDTLGFAPAKLILTYDPRVPLDLMKEFVGSPQFEESQLTYAETVSKRIQTCFQTAHKRTAAAKSTQKSQYDGRGVHGDFQVDDRVWLYNPATPRGLSSKLHHHWTGPFTILEKMSEVTYKVKADDQQRSRIVHHNRLKRCYSERAPKPPRRDFTNPPELVQPPATTRVHTGLEAHHVISSEVPSTSCSADALDHELPRDPIQQARADISTRPQRQRKPPDRFGNSVSY